MAMAMMESVFRQFRATPDRIDRQSERVRSGLFRDVPCDDTLPEGRTLPDLTDEAAAN